MDSLATNGSDATQHPNQYQPRALPILDLEETRLRDDILHVCRQMIQVTEHCLYAIGWDGTGEWEGLNPDHIGNADLLDEALRCEQTIRLLDGYRARLARLAPAAHANAKLAPFMADLEQHNQTSYLAMQALTQALAGELQARGVTRPTAASGEAD